MEALLGCLGEEFGVVATGEKVLNSTGDLV
jgi:hypothetical protein